jgi:DNA-binding MarR family transcriptional regulator
MQDEALDFDSSMILDAIRRIVQAMRLSSRRTEQEIGVSGAQLFVLQALAKAEGVLSISDVAALTLTHLSSVSVVIAKLVDRGFVLKSYSAEDGRRIEVRLSAKGKTFLQRNVPMTMQEHLVRSLALLPAEKRKILAQLLTTVVTDAGFSHEDAAMFFEDEEAGVSDGGDDL